MGARFTALQLRFRVATSARRLTPRIDDFQRHIVKVFGVSGDQPQVMVQRRGRQQSAPVDGHVGDDRQNARAKPVEHVDVGVRAHQFRNHIRVNQVALRLARTAAANPCNTGTVCSKLMQASVTDTPCFRGWPGTMS